MKIIFSSLLLFFFISCVPVSKPEKKWPELEIQEKFRLQIPEPSDICLSPDQKSFYIVRDRGSLYQTDLKGQILQKARVRGGDLEGVWFQSPYLHVVDEGLMKISVLDTNTFKKVSSHKYDIPIRSNKGWESITYNPIRKSFVLFTEKKPVKFFELNNVYKITREEETDQFKEVSSCTWYKNKLWVLSDEEEELYRVNPDTYELERGWSIPVVNPEGICFTKDGQLYIISDRRSMLYVFKQPDWLK